MEIRNLRLDKIENLGIGQTFELEGKFYMKVSFGSLSYTNTEDFPNAVIDLETSKINSFRDGIEVNIIDSELIIK